jgi:hypothetical protein
MSYKVSGAVAISTILITGILVSEIAIAALVVSYFGSQGGLGTRVVYNASFAAQSGIEDALLKIIRNKDFVPSPYPYYTISVGSATALIVVCHNDLVVSGETCIAADPSLPDGTYDITSLGMALNKQVKINARLFTDPSTGLMNIQYVREIST